MLKGMTTEVLRRVGAPLPGLVAAGGLALLAEITAAALPVEVGAAAIAVVLGLAVGQRTPAVLERGFGVGRREVLRVGIVLLGARLSLADVGALGGSVAPIAAGLMAVAFGLAWWLGGRLGLTDRLRALLGVGSAVCGNSAIMAAAPVVRAREQEVGIAVATITVLGTVGVLVYPILGRALGLSDTEFGIWAGLAVHDTSQVVAAGAAFSEQARDVATLTKLVRNALLAAVLPLLAWRWGRASGTGGNLRAALPGFVLGFLALAALRSVGVLPAALAGPLGEAADVCIIVAVVSLGAGVRFRDLAAAGLRPAAVGAAVAVVLATAGLWIGVLLG